MLDVCAIHCANYFTQIIPYDPLNNPKTIVIFIPT